LRVEVYPKEETSTKQAARGIQIPGVLSQKIEFFTVNTVRTSTRINFI
jgi:hypothetical protein